jgi:hypothetical protein
MLLSALTAIHVAISLVGIGAGLVVLYGLLTSQRFEGWTKLFLTTTAATSLSGFLFPFHTFLPSHAVGIVSLIVLAIAILARYQFGLAGAWRRGYVVAAVIALYLNLFVLVVQLFQKVPALRTLAPTQSEPPFQIVQVTILLIFVVLGFRASKTGVLTA